MTTQEKTFAIRFNFPAFTALENWQFDDAYQELLDFGTDEETLHIVQALVVLVGNGQPDGQSGAIRVLVETTLKYLFRGKEA